MRHILLIIDDSKLIRQMLRNEFQREYDILEADNGKTGLEYIEKHHEELVAVLLDMVMPEMNGLEILKVLHEKEYMDTFPVLVVTSEQPAGIVEQCFDYGISDFIRKPINASIMRKRVDRLRSLFIQRDEFRELVEFKTKTIKSQYNMLKKQAEKLKQNNETVIDMIGSIVEYRNYESKEYIQRLKELTKILAGHMAKLYPEYKLTDDKIANIVSASALHDIGKIFISDTVLLKAGTLTESEQEYVRSHTLRGCEAINSMSIMMNEGFAKTCYNICRNHHERYDGSGYPDGLKGEEIPIEAEIVGLIDAYDELISERNYKKAYSLDLSYRMIIRGDCGVFSPTLLEAFRSARRDLEECVTKKE